MQWRRRCQRRRRGRTQRRRRQQGAGDLLLLRTGCLAEGEDRALRGPPSRALGEPARPPPCTGLPSPLALLREVARALSSAALVLACFLPLAVPLAWGGARLVAAGLARWAWELESQAAWEYLATRLLHTIPAFPAPLAANTALPGTVPAILLGAGPSTETVQAVGIVWTWSCYALAAWRKSQTRR